MRSFYKYKTTDFSGDKAQGDYEDDDLRGSDMEQYQEVCRMIRYVPNYTCIFLDFVRGFGSYVKGLPKTKR